jgi:hypothetical protein
LLDSSGRLRGFVFDLETKEARGQSAVTLVSTINAQGGIAVATFQLGSQNGVVNHTAVHFEKQQFVATLARRRHVASPSSHHANAV